MSKAQNQKLPWKPYPEAVAYRGGCKVSWRYYRDEDTAVKASAVAVWNGRIRRQLGYDTGYCTAGSVRRVPEGVEHAGLWEVCIP